MRVRGGGRRGGGSGWGWGVGLGVGGRVGGGQLCKPTMHRVKFLPVLAIGNYENKVKWSRVE